MACGFRTIIEYHPIVRYTAGNELAIKTNMSLPLVIELVRAEVLNENIRSQVQWLKKECKIL